MTWARFDDQFPDHPKVAEAGPLAGWLHVCAICYSARMLTDGFIPKGQVRKLADIENVTPLVTALLTAGLWEQCDGGYKVHDYEDYNPKAEDVKAQREANAERQRRFRDRDKKTGKFSQENNPPRNVHSNTNSNAVTNTTPVPVPVPVPLKVKETNVSSCSDSDESNEKSESHHYQEDTPEYQTALRLDHLIQRNNPRRKEPSDTTLQKWADIVRLMVERDQRSVPDILAVIRWCQDDEFWRGNILSMGKLRKQFDQLWIKMQAPARASPEGRTRQGVRNGVGLMREIQEQERNGRIGSTEVDLSDWRTIPKLSSG